MSLAFVCKSQVVPRDGCGRGIVLGGCGGGRGQGVGGGVGEVRGYYCEWVATTVEDWFGTSTSRRLGAEVDGYCDKKDQAEECQLKL